MCRLLQVPSPTCEHICVRLDGIATTKGTCSWPYRRDLRTGLDVCSCADCRPGAVPGSGSSRLRRRGMSGSIASALVMLPRSGSSWMRIA